MAPKASNYLPICLLLLTFPLQAFALTGLDADLNDANLKKDWPAIVLLLQTRKGQNFEHDLTLAKALLSLERRQEAIKLLSSLQDTHKDERLTKLLVSAGTLFFNQETSNFYYEAIEFIGAQRFAEARDRLEQALAKEPGQILLLNRLIQMQLVLNQEEAALGNLKIVQASGLSFPEWRGFAAKLDVDQKINEDDEEDALFKKLKPIRSQLLENQVTATYWIEAVKRSDDEDEMTILALKTLNDHPLWSYALMAMVKSEQLTPAIKAKVLTQIQKNLSSKDAFQTALDTEMKRTQNLWVGYVSYDLLQTELSASLCSSDPVSKTELTTRKK